MVEVVLEVVVVILIMIMVIILLITVEVVVIAIEHLAIYTFLKIWRVWLKN